MAHGGGPRQVKLDRESELRIEVGYDAPLKLRLLSGTAEIFGTELPPDFWLTFPPRLKFAVFTWNGATIEMEGSTETEYTADETPNISYVNVHSVLEERRHRAKPLPPDDPNSQGPRVIVVGPTDSGKSTLSKMLLSWAAKKGWKPTFVDLDIGQGAITIPGCIAATPIEMPIDPVEGIPLDIPLVYFYGHTTPSNNVDLYKVLVKELAQVVERQLSGNAESRASGMVINTMGWIEGQGYELLLHAIDTFNANVVLVLGQEKLWSMIRNVLKNKPGVDVVKLQKSGGVVSRNAKFRQKSRSLRIREYFYGLANDLSPHSNIANFSDFSVFRIGGGPQAPRSALPIGAEPAADPTRSAPVNINRDLLHTILAVSFAKEPDQIISSNVAGFVFVTDVDIQSTMEEGGRYKSPPAAHELIFYSINSLGVLLQVKHATANLPSPFVTDHNTVAILIADLLTYAGTLQTANILQASNNTNIYELMNNISLLCGTLALVLLVLLLVPAFGWFTLACWAVYFAIIGTKSFQILRGLCTAAVGYVSDKYQALIRLCTAAVGYVTRE